MVALALPVVVPYYILIHILFKIDTQMLIWRPWLLLCSPLIQNLILKDAKCSSGCFGSSCGGSVFKSYSELMQNVLLPPWLLL